MTKSTGPRFVWRALWRLWSLAIAAGLFATCDTFQQPTEVAANLKVSYQGDTVLFVGDVIRPVIVVTRDNNPITGPRVRFTSADSGMIAPDDSGRIAVLKRGVTAVHILLVGSTLGSTPPETTVHIVAVAKAARIKQSTLSLGALKDTLTVTAEALKVNGAVIDGTTFKWGSSDTLVATVSQAGLVTALKNGTAVISAIVDNDTATTTLTVSQVLRGYTFQRGGVSVSTVSFDALGDTLTLTAVPHDSGGSPIPVGASPAFTWSVPAGQTVATISVGGLVRAGTSNGGTRAIATSGTVVDTIHVDVSQVAQQVRIIGPRVVPIGAVNQATSLSAIATDRLGQTIANTNPTWRSDEVVVHVVSATLGQLLTLATGSAYVYATLGNGKDSVQFQVTNLAVGLTLTQGGSPIPGGTLSLGAVGAGTTNVIVAQPVNSTGANLTLEAVTWVSANSSVAQVTPVAGQLGQANILAMGVGNTTVTATTVAGGFSASLTVSVTNSPLTIDIIPTNLTLASVGDFNQPVVDIKNTQGQPLPRTSVTWTSDDPTIASVSADGTITAVNGSATSVYIHAISPVSAGLRDSILVTVTNAPATVSLNLHNQTLTAPTKTIAFVATVKNAKGNTITGSGVVTWVPTIPAVASVDANGVATALSVGTTLIIAQAGSGAGLKADTATLVVQNLPKAVNVSPALVGLPAVAATQQLTPTVLNTLDNVIPGLALTYATSDASVATVSITGLVTGIGVGSATITVTTPLAAGPQIQASVPVTVASSSVPATLTIAPAGPVALTAFGATINFAATVKNAAGAVVPTPNPAVTWSSNNAAVTINASTGVATTVSNGSATITATAGVATANVTVNVAQAASASRSTISSSLPSLTADGASTATITIQLKDSLGVNLSASGGVVTLSRSGTGTVSAVTDNGNGTYTATLTAPFAIGNGTISASVGGASFTTGNPTISYTASAATKYIVTPSSTTPVVGTSITVSGQLVDVNNNPVTTLGKTVTWSFTGGTGTFTTANPSTTNASGVASVTFTVSSSTTTQFITATDNTALTGTSSPVTTISASANNYLVTPATLSPAAGSGVVVTAQLRDASGNPIALAGQVVTWGASSGGFSAATTNTNGSGVATVTFNTVTIAGTSTTVTATTGGVSGASSTITTVAGAASATTTTIGASSNTVTAGASVTITVTARDANSNLLTASGGTVALHTTLGSLNSVIDNGNGTYTATLSTAVAGSAVVSGTINGVAITSGNQTITVNPAATASAALTTATVPAGTAGSATSVTVQAKDANGNNLTVGGATVVATVTGSNNATPTVTDVGNGSYTFSYTPTVAGSDAVAITLGGTAIGGSPYTSVVVAAALSTFQVETAGGGAIATQAAGTSFNIRVTARDAGGNLVTTFTGTVDISSGTGTLSAGGTTTAAFTAGVLASHAVTFSTTGSNTVTATKTGGGAAGTSGAFTVNPAPATQLVITTQPSATATAGATFGQSAVVEIRNAANSVVTSDNSTVVTATRLSGTGVLQGTVTATAVSGVATFNNLSYNVAETITIRFTSGNLTGATSNNVAVSAAAAAAAQSVATVPAGTAGSATSVTVQAKDQFGNSVGTGGATVVATVTGTNSATPTVTDVGNGTYTFSYTPTLAGTDQLAITLGGTAIGGSPYTSVVSAGALASFQVETAGGGAIATQAAGTSFNIRVTARDAGGNLVTTFTGTVDISSGTGTLSAGGTTTAAFTAGVLASHAVTFSTSGSNTITATKTGGGAAGTSSSFTVNGPPATQLVITTQPSATATAGATFGTSAVVEVRDAGNNVVTSDNSTVVTATRLSGTGALQGTVTATAVSGVATFNNLSYNVAETITIRFTSGNLAGATSNNVAVSAAAAAAAQSVATVPAGTAGSATSVTVQAKDQFGNNVGTGGATVVATVTGTNSATPTVTDVGNGTYTFSYTPSLAGTDQIAITLGGTAISGSPYTSTVSSGTVASFLVEAAGGGAIGTQSAGAAFNIRVTARDAGGNLVTTFTGTVDISSGTGTLSAGGTTTAAFAAGILASHAVTFSTIGVSQTVTATKTGGGASGTSNAFTVVTGAANAATSTASVPGAGTAGSITTISVQAKDANGNSRTTTSGTVTVVVSNANSATATVVDNLDGTYTATYTPTATGTDDIVIRLGGVLISGNTFHSTVGTGTASAARTTIAAGVGSLTADGAATTTMTVRAKDAQGNNLPGGGATVTLTTTAGTLTSVASGTSTTVTADDQADGTYTATLNAPTTASSATISGTLNGPAITSGNATVSFVAGAATQLLVLTQPSSTATAGIAFTTQPAIRVADANGNTVLTDNGRTITAARNGGSGVLQGTLAANTVNGVATFTNLAHNVATAITIDFTGGLTTATSNAVTVAAGVATQLVISTQPPTTATAGVTFSSSTVVDVRDALGNVRTQDNSTVVTAARQTGTGTLQGTLTATASSGQATFSALSYNVAENLAIRFSSGNLTAATSSPVTAVSAAAANAAHTVALVPAGSAGTLTTITVTIKDAFDNVAACDGNTVAATVTGANAGTSASVGACSSGAFAVTYTPTAVGTDAIAITLNATAINGSPFTSVVSSSGTATKYLVTSTSFSPTAGTSVIISAQLADVGNNPVATAGKTVTWSKTGTGGTFASATSVTDATGKALVSFTVSTVANTIHDVTALDNTALTGTSADITVQPGTAAVLVVTGSASQTAGAPQTVTITAKDAFGNTATGYATDKSLTFSGPANAPNGTVPTATDKTASPINFGTSTTVTFTAGVASSDVVLYKAESTNIAVTDGSISAAAGNRLAVTVTAAVLNNFAFVLASPQTDGLVFTGTNTLTARDVYNNTKTTFNASTDNVTIAPDGVSLVGTVSGLSGGNKLTGGGDFVSGVANLTGTLTFTGTEGTGTFTATSVSGKSGTSGSVTIDPGAATHFVIAGNSPQTAGTSQNIVISALDVGENVATSYTGDKSITFSGASTAASGDAPTVTDKNAVARTFGTATTITFTAGASSSTASMVLYKAETANIVATDGGITTTGGDILTVQVDPASLSDFAVTDPSGAVIPTQASTTPFDIKVVARDAFRNTVTSFTGAGNTVDISLNSGTGTGSLTQGLGTTAAFVNGVLATHTVEITVTLAGTFSITATRTSGGAQFGTSNLFQVN